MDRLEVFCQTPAPGFLRLQRARDSSILAAVGFWIVGFGYFFILVSFLG